jgi:3-dehydrosphinganine reductase
MEQVGKFYCLTTGLNLIPGQFDYRCWIPLYRGVMYIAQFVGDLLSWVGFVWAVIYLYKWMRPSVKKKKKARKYRGKHVFITGGTSGLGYATAKLFAKRGANVTITGRSQDTLDKAVAVIMQLAKYGSQKVGGTLVDFEAHSSDKLALGTRINACVKNRGPVDILICCAGQSKMGAFGSIAETCAENLMTINYWGTYKMIAQILPSMKERNVGHIVAISHHCATRTFEGYSAVNPTKMAVRGLMQTLQSEFSKTDITFQLFAPLPTNTKGRTRENLTKPKMTKGFEDYLYEMEEPEQVAESLLDAIQSKDFYATSGSALFQLQMMEGGHWTNSSRLVAFLGRQLMSWIHLLDSPPTAMRKVVVDQMSPL